MERAGFAGSVGCDFPERFFVDFSDSLGALDFFWIPPLASLPLVFLVEAARFTGSVSASLSTSASPDLDDFFFFWLFSVMVRPIWPRSCGNR